MNHTIKKIHLWLALPFGIVISIICLTGGLYVFKSELQELAHHKRYYVKEVKGEPLPVGSLVKMVQGQIPDSLKIASLTLLSDKKKNYSFGIKGYKRASIKVDPYSGEVREIEMPAHKDFFSVVLRLHRRLLANYKRGEFSWGKFITGVSTLLFFFVLISGIIIWVPKNPKELKNRLSIKFKKSRFRFWYDLHLAGGIYVAIFLIAFCLTGLTWSFDWYRIGFYKLFGASTTQNKSIPQKSEGAKDGPDKPYAVWDLVIEQLKEQNPGFALLYIKPGAAKVAKGRNASIRRADNYTFDTQTGEITSVAYFKDTQNKASKVRHWVYLVHTGKWGGMVTKFLSFIACLLGATLPLTGYYIYFKKTLKNKRDKAALRTHL